MNTSFQNNNDHARIASPAATRLMLKLGPFIEGLFPGRLQARLSGKFIQTLNQQGVVNFSLLDQFDCQKDYPFYQLVQTNYQLTIEKGAAKLIIPIYQGCVTRMNTLVTDYYFEMVLVHGDASKERSLRIDSVESGLFSYNSSDKTDCLLELTLPPANKDWMILLKMNSHEGRQMAAHGKNYGLKVIMVKQAAV